MALPELDVSAAAPDDGTGSPQEGMVAGSLQRVLGPVGVSLLTLSVLSPGASVWWRGSTSCTAREPWAALAFLLGGLLT